MAVGDKKRALMASDIDDAVGGYGVIGMDKKGAANGVAELDGNGKVPASQLPSYVDDVVEYASVSAFPATGESGIIYIALDTNITYRWGGTEYVAIGSSLALGETSTTAYRGDRGKVAYDFSQDPYTSNPEEDGTASPGDSTKWARGNHRHPHDTSKLDTTGDGSDVTAAFSAASARSNISTGEKLSVIFGKIAKWFTDLGTAAFRAATGSVTQSSTDLIESGAVYTALGDKQAKITASGILKGDGAGGVSAATAGTDYQTPLTAGTDYATPGMIPSVPSAYSSNPEMDGTASPGSSGSWAKGDHVHPTDTSRAAAVDLTSTQQDIAYVLSDPAGVNVAAGQFAIYNNTLYKATAAIASSDAASSFTSKLTAVNGGIGNELKSAFETTDITSDFTPEAGATVEVLKTGNTVQINFSLETGSYSGGHRVTYIPAAYKPKSTTSFGLAINGSTNGYAGVAWLTQSSLLVYFAQSLTSVGIVGSITYFM